jgi:quinohemoprotein ethanol dehydrogenase
LTALDKKSGDLLWEFQTDAGVHAAPSTFEHEGEQYVVVLSAGAFFPNTTRGDSVWLFSLRGDSTPRPPSGAARPSQSGDLTH